jgi:hypothetical protein
MSEEKATNTVTPSTIPDAWQTESGLPDDLDAVIINGVWTTSPEYHEGTTVLKLTCEDADHDTFEMLIPAGKGWIIKDGGKRVEHEKGKQHFITSSIYGRFITRVVTELGVKMPLNTSPMNAEVWIGLAFHFEREEIEYKGLNNEKKIIHLMPTLYLPDFAAATAAKAPALDIPPELNATLTTYAQASPDFASFFKLAFKLPELKANPELLNNVMLETDAGYYKTHHSK